MTKKLLLLIVLLSANYSWLAAQTPAADSLKKLLVAHSTADTTRANLLNRLAMELRRSKPGQVDTLAEEAFTISDKLNYSKGKGEALSLKGMRFYDKLDYHSAYSAFEQGEKLLESAGDKNGLGFLLRIRATLYMDDGKYAQSLDDFLRGLKLAQEVGNVKLIVDIERTIGYLYNILGEYAKAIPYQTDALKEAESIGYKIGMSGAYNAIGKTYKTQGNYPASLEGYTKGLRIDEELKDSGGIAIDHGNIGDVYERMGNYPEAFSHINVYLNYHYPRPKVEDRISWGEWVIGKAYTHSGDPTKGFYYATHSLALANKVGWRLYLREITQLIAESAAKLKQ